MCVLQRAQDLRDKIDRLADIDRALLADVFLEGDALDIFHDDILQPVAVADVEDLDDVRVRKHRDRLGLVLETAAELLVRQILVFEDLDRDDAVVDVIERFINNGHAADADDLDDLIASV